MNISIISYLFVLQLIIINVAIAQSLTHDVFRCGGGDYPANSPWEKNFKIAFDRVLNNIEISRGFDFQNQEQVWTAGFCPGYVKLDACKECVKKLIPMFDKQCVRNKKAIAWSLKCMVLKSDFYPFRSALDYEWSYLQLSLDAKVSKVDEFDSIWKSLADKLTQKVAIAARNSNKQFASGNEKYGSQTLYMAVECVGNYHESICAACLSRHVKNMKSCCSGKTTASLVSNSCYIKHALDNFLN